MSTRAEPSVPLTNKKSEAARQWRLANPERFREYQRAYRQRPEVKARMKVHRQRWRAKNPERVREINRRWAKNMDPADRQFWNSQNRLRRAGSAIRGDTRAWARILRTDCCAYCGRDATVVDHIEPIVSGGSGEWDNLTGACRSCNARKKDRPLLHFLLAVSDAR